MTQKGVAMVRLTILCMTLLTGLALAHTAAAAEDLDAFYGEDLAALYGDEEFVSIATGSAKPVNKAPAVASVITAKDIETMGATDLNQVLETVPGLHVSLSALSRLDAVYSIRGIHTGFNPQVLLLMNGLSFPELYTGAHPILFRLPVANIARIEVIRGPGSAIYGAEAYAGVINIITKDAADIAGTEVGGREGSFGTHGAWLQHGGTYGDWDLAFSFEWQQSDGDRGRRISSDAQSKNDLDNGTDASLAPGALDTRYEVFDSHLELKRPTATGDWKLRLWNWQLIDAGVGAGAAQALDPEGYQEGNLLLTDLSYDSAGLFPDTSLTATLSYQYLDNDVHFVLYPPQMAFPDGLIADPEGTENIFGLDLATLFHQVKNHRIRLGAGGKHQRLDTQEAKNFGPGAPDGTLTDVSDTPHVYAPDKSRTIWYLSLQDEWQLAPDWELTAGVRYDRYTDFGSTVNPRLALVWATRHNLTTKLLYGSAFRAPSFSELHAINNPVVLGNSDLDPETIDTLELAFDYRPTFNLHLGLSLFAYEAKDLIEFVPDAGAGTSTAQNARDQRGRGLELEADWDLCTALRLRANYALQHAEDKQSNEEVPDAPGQQFYLQADWQFLPDWSFTPQLNWVGDRERAATDSRAAIDDYTLVDLTLRRKGLFKNLEVALSMRNVFDEDAREPSSDLIADDYPLEGRSIWGEISWRM